MGANTTIEIHGENAFIRFDNCEHKVCPEDSGYKVCTEGSEVKLCIPVGVAGEPGLVTLAHFTTMMNLYNAALLPFLTNEAAHTALGAGKEFIFAQGSPEAPQGVKAITYTP